MKVRRRVLLGGAVAGGAAIMTGSLTLGGTAAPILFPDANHTRGYTEAHTPHLQIIAHPDDDLFFFNTDTQHSIAAGHPVITVCITAGESNGHNGIHAKRRNFADYVAARQTGHRSAYALMAGLGEDAPWHRRALALPHGAHAEIATLHGKPDITLIYLNLWEDGARHPRAHGIRLAGLWSGADARHDAMVPTGSPLSRPSRFTRAGLAGALAHIIDAFKPSLVRTMDPDPDPQVHDAANPRFADQDGFSDHIDHTAAGLFAMSVLHGHAKHSCVVEAYRGYYNRRWPRNLSASARRGKTKLLEAYGWRDGRDCGAAWGCGDRRLIRHRDHVASYVGSTNYRYAADTNWMHADDDGIFAVSVERGRMVHWNHDGSAWKKTRSHAGGWYLPTVHIGRTGAGEALALAMRASYGPDPRDETRQLVVRSVTARGLGAAVSLGNPDSGASDVRAWRGLGVPAVVPSPGGGAIVAVRNFFRQLSLRRLSANGQWGRWEHVNGPIVQDGLCGVSTKEYTEIFGSGVDGVVCWRQSKGEWTSSVIPDAAVASAPTLVRLANGATLLLVREARTRHLLVFRRESDDADWQSPPLRLQTTGGFGPVAAIAPPAWDGRVALATRNESGTIGLAIIDGRSGRFESSWGDGGPFFVHAPSLTVDDGDRLVATVIGADGALYSARQTEPGTGLPRTWKAARAASRA